jgi:hypothetical protein
VAAGGWAGWIALLATWACLGGCAAPTLPLPPPAALALTSPDPATGLVTVSGEAVAGAFVSCVNVRTSTGVIVRAGTAGVFSLQIAAQAGDSLLVWQEIDSDRGPYVELCVDCLVRDR